eukprot:TRINITY_DN33752_c0_g1_i1.p1 TRINITY_DN33752_c0_g1~~TRINITY_DN33752_c0_g1_i1.p1  ORF type:complete len:177 (+),score=51.28 TRINITY_DN33752_c0_g1_i1:61-591(+)
MATSASGKSTAALDAVQEIVQQLLRITTELSDSLEADSSSLQPEEFGKMLNHYSQFLSDLDGKASDIEGLRIPIEALRHLDEEQGSALSTWCQGLLKSLTEQSQDLKCRRAPLNPLTRSLREAGWGCPKLATAAAASGCGSGDAAAAHNVDAGGSGASAASAEAKAEQLQKKPRLE